MTPDFDRIRHNIRAIMNNKGFSASGLSLAAGLSRNTLTNFLKGYQSSLSMDKLAAVANAADVDFGDLVGIELLPSEKPDPQIMRDAHAIIRYDELASGFEEARITELAKAAAQIAATYGDGHFNKHLANYLIAVENLRKKNN